MIRTPFSEEIREAVRRSERTGYDVAKAMNVAPSTLHRFVHGQCGLALALLDRLAEAIDLHVVIGTKRKKG
jgi:plasmid maintenance system antidote protein VapI